MPRPARNATTGRHRTTGRAFLRTATLKGADRIGRSSVLVPDAKKMRGPYDSSGGFIARKLR